MKTKFTSLLGASLILLGSVTAQDVKTPDENYSRFDFLKVKDKTNGDQKAIDAALTATGGYVSDNTVDIPMSLILDNTDFEYGDEVTITFPAGFTINSVSNDDVFGPSFDDPDGPEGDPEPYNGIVDQTVSWGDDDNLYGGITPGNPYPFTINVTADNTVSGDQTIDYTVSGDGFGPNPADFAGSITISESSVSLPLGFELPVDLYTLVGFGGADNTSIIPNPDQSGINTSANVWQQTQNSAAAETFAGAVIDLDEAVDFSESTLVAMDIWTPLAATDVTLRFEVADNNPPTDGIELTIPTTATSSWETLTFDFSDNPNIGNEFVRCVVFFNLGAPNTDDTFYIDNIRSATLPTIFEIVEGSEVHTTLETALIESGLNGVTSDPEVDLTLFAPTDAAFDGLPDGVLTSLLDDPTGALANVLLYHVVAGTALSTDLSDGQEVLTLQGETVTVGIDAGIITINGAEVTIADIPAENGVVHVIDAVLVPELCTVFVGGPYGDFNTSFGGAPLAQDGICPFNVLTAFESWASEGYVVDNCVAGTTYTFGLSGGATGAWDPAFIVVDATTGEVIASETEGLSITWECPADGEYIWIIQEEGFCGGQSDNTGTNNGFPYMTCESAVTITDIVVSSDIHTTLETAVIEAELDGILAGEGPFTVFAPTDAAFDLLPDGLLDDLLGDPFGDLTTVLTHHVANGIAYSTDLSDGQSVPTLQGEDVTVGIDGAGVVTITSATGVVAEVIVANLIASNGVVHVIDAVLIPTLSSVDNLSSVDDLSVFPNPTNNQFTVDIELNASERVTVDLVNIVGQVVKSVDLGNRSAGLNREYIDVNDLSEGIYFMNLTVGDTQGTVKVQVVR